MSDENSNAQLIMEQLESIQNEDFNVTDVVVTHRKSGCFLSIIVTIVIDAHTSLSFVFV